MLCICKICSRCFEWEPDKRFREQIIDVGAGWMSPPFCSKTCYIQNEEKEISELFLREKSLSSNLARTILPKIEKLQSQIDSLTDSVEEVTDVYNEAVRRNLHYQREKEADDWRWPDHKSSEAPL